MRILPGVDRPVAGGHRRTRRLRALPGGRGPIPGGPEGALRFFRATMGARRAVVERGRGRAPGSVPRTGAGMDVVAVPARPWTRLGRGARLSLRRQPSPRPASRDPVDLGIASRPARRAIHLLGLSSPPRPHLSRRVSLRVGPDPWTRGVGRGPPGQGISRRPPRTVRRPGVVDRSDAGVARRRRRLPARALRGRRALLAAPRAGRRPAGLPRGALGAVSLGLRPGPELLLVPMGQPSAGDGTSLRPARAGDALVVPWRWRPSAARGTLAP